MSLDVVVAANELEHPASELHLTDNFLRGLDLAFAPFGPLILGSGILQIGNITAG